MIDIVTIVLFSEPDIFCEWGQGPADVEEGEGHRDDVDLCHRIRARARYVGLEINQFK